MVTPPIPPPNIDIVTMNDDGTPDVTGLEHDTIRAADGTPYLRRYFLHRNYSAGSLQLHHILTDDPEPDPHDHPWDFTSVILTGGYRDISPTGSVEHRAPSVIARVAETPHRLELLDGPTWTLVATGPVRRRWGYHLTTGWVDWRHYRGQPTRPPTRRPHPRTTRRW